MNATILDPEIYSLAKRWADSVYDKPSAYKSGAIVKKYKELGGRYGGAEKKKTALNRWFQEEWRDVGGKDYPVYRPTKKINSKTPLITTEIDPKDLKHKITQKQRIKGSRNLSPFRKK
jgi:hypothetical protein